LGCFYYPRNVTSFLSRTCVVCGLPFVHVDKEIIMFHSINYLRD